MATHQNNSPRDKPVVANKRTGEGRDLAPTAAQISNRVPLTISVDKVCFIVMSERRYAVKDVDTELEGGNATDDGMSDVLENNADDAIRQQLVGFIHALNIDEQLDLVTLAWVGRGDAGMEDWHRLRSLAGQEHGSSVAQYLLNMPLLADYLEEALSMVGESCVEIESNHL